MDTKHSELNPPEETVSDIAQRHTARFRDAISGIPMAVSDPEQTRRAVPLPIEPRSESLPGRIWWGSATRRSAKWAGTQGMNLLSSTVLSEDTGVPFAQLQAEQIRSFQSAWSEAGHMGTPRVAVTRSVLPILSAFDREMYGANVTEEHVGILGGAISRFGKSYVGSPDAISAQLAEDEAVASADTLLITIPNLLGVDENLRLLNNIVEYVAPGLE